MNLKLSVLKKLQLILSQYYLTRLFYLQLLYIISAILELIVILIVTPLLTQNYDLTIISEFLFLLSKTISDNTTYINLIFMYCLLSLLIILASTALTIFLSWWSALFGSRVGAHFSAQLFSYYINRSCDENNSSSASESTKLVSIECDRVSGQIVHPLLVINSRIIVLVVIIIGLLSISAVNTILGVTLILTIYLGIYRFSRGILHNNGRIITIKNTRRFQVLNDSFNGFKEIKIQNVGSIFKSEFSELSYQIANARGVNLAIAQMPKKFIELIIFAVVIIATMVTSFKQESASLLASVTLFGIAGLKVLPVLQQIFTSVTQVRANLPALDAIYPEFIKSTKIKIENDIPIKFDGEIHFSNVAYKHHDTSSTILQDITLTIKKFQRVAIVGPSGAGKTTLLNLITGLANETEGEIWIDESKIDQDSYASWRNMISYVPQASFILNDSLLNNIIFGQEKAIDYDRIKHVLEKAQLVDFVNGLENGYNTLLEEEGSRLSGGEKQRIAIARALYSDRPVLVLDEATSSQDLETERKILKSIYSRDLKKTVIIVSHRLASVKPCDQIFVMKNGRITQKGLYRELLNSKGIFNSMISEEERSL